MLFPNSLALGGNLESISEPYYIRIPSSKTHIFGLNEITSFWNDSNPKTKSHLGLERELWIWRSVWMKYMLWCSIVTIFLLEMGESLDTNGGIGWLVSRIFLRFPIHLYVAVSQSSVLSCFCIHWENAPWLTIFGFSYLPS